MPTNSVSLHAARKLFIYFLRNPRGQISWRKAFELLEFFPDGREAGSWLNNHLGAHDVCNH